MLLLENIRFKEIFLSYIKKVGSTTSSYGGYYYNNSYYNGSNMNSSSVGGNPSSSFVKPSYPNKNYIYFYEWSNTHNKAKIFENFDDLEKYCKDNKITICEHHEGMIRQRYYSYATCIPGHSVLMVRNTFYELEKALESYQIHPVGSHC